ncbi:hypothetical protein HanXRQr2_Chr03g0103451 [Helianthus annuus]|uniref:Uncharacterized protein n=1 Tax=Helianthus annuus TaxID=4232 RepID=A0A9K3JEX2_HELAN|nr:hypothetical protein HanXRQr2_Chr03g0103451 [Helianthus annuus]KAJ0943096.1 hypothetical protein HanPSC8_Chr03g0099941 [Helianthus annuus]
MDCFGIIPEKARLQAAAEAAENATRRAEVEAALEAKRKRDLEREAARQVLLKLIEEEKVEVPVSNIKYGMDKAPAEVASTNENDVNMQDASLTENGAVETGDNPVQMDHLTVK